MQTTTEINRSNQYSNHDDELENCTATMTTLNARAVTSIKHPKSTFSVSYPAVMIIFDIHKQALNNESNKQKVTYTPTIYHLAPKCPYSLPKSEYDKPIALIECLYPRFKKDCNGNSLSYTIQNITIAFEGIKFEPVTEERFIVASPKAKLLIYDYGEQTAQIHEATGNFITPLRVNSQSKNSRKMPLIWRLRPNHKIVLSNHILISQIFHLVTINERPSKL